jgi:hypothetical protein
MQHVGKFAMDISRLLGDANSVVSNRQARAATKAYVKAKFQMELTDSETRALERRDAA